MADWEVTQKMAQAMGLGWNYTHPSEIMDELAGETAMNFRLSRK